MNTTIDRLFTILCAYVGLAFPLDSLYATAQAADVRVTNVYVARARLVSGPNNFEGSNRQYADYDIVQSLRGAFSHTRIRAKFVQGTLRGELPHDAILLLEPPPVELRDIFLGAVIGHEAWRGIFPYSPELAQRIQNMSDEEIGRSKPEDLLPEEIAIDLARQYVEDHGLFAHLLHQNIEFPSVEDSSAAFEPDLESSHGEGLNEEDTYEDSPFRWEDVTYDRTVRHPFGWAVGVYYRQEWKYIVYVSDTGEALTHLAVW